MIPSSPTPSYKSFGQSLVIPSKHVIYKKVASDSLKFTQASPAIFLDEVGKIGFQAQAWLDSAASCVTNIRRLCYICFAWSWFSFNNPFSKWTGYMIHVIWSKKTPKGMKIQMATQRPTPPRPISLCSSASQMHPRLQKLQQRHRQEIPTEHKALRRMSLAAAAAPSSPKSKEPVHTSFLWVIQTQP